MENPISFLANYQFQTDLPPSPPLQPTPKASSVDSVACACIARYAAATAAAWKPQFRKTKLFTQRSFSHALLELVDQLFVRDGFLMSHLQPFSITHLCRFFNKNHRIHSDFSIPSALFSGSHCNGVNHSCSNCRCFHQCLAPHPSFSMLFHTQTESNSSNAQAQCFSIGKNSKGWGKGWTSLLLNCWTQQRRFFFKKKTTKLKETTTSKTVSFCWCNICTESFGIRFLYLRPSTTCDL